MKAQGLTMRYVRMLVPFAVVVWCAHAASRPLIIRNVTVVEVEAGRTIPGMSLKIAGERIVSVGKNTRVPKDVITLDASGLYVIPGLWDMHVHAFWTESTPQRMFPLFLANGVTGIRDMGSPLDLKQLGRMRAHYETQPDAPRLIMAGKLVDGDPPVWEGSISLSNAAGAENAVQALRAGRADVLKVYSRLSHDAYIAMVRAAKRAGLPVVGHIPISISAEKWNCSPKQASARQGLSRQRRSTRQGQLARRGNMEQSGLAGWQIWFCWRRTRSQTFGMRAESGPSF